MSKYDPLEDYLKQTPQDQIPMGFSEVENVLGFQLPPTSRKQRAWWSNNASNNVMTQAWIDAGYETANVDMEAQTLTFKRVKPAVESKLAADSPKIPRRHPLFGAMKGLLTLPPDLDLTLPADPDWGDTVNG